MIFVDDEPNCGCGCDKQNNAPVYPVVEKLDSLQTSVDKLNKSFFYVNTDIENLKETCAAISVQANNYTDAEINELRDDINQSIADSVNTAQPEARLLTSPLQQRAAAEWPSAHP